MPGSSPRKLKLRASSWGKRIMESAPSSCATMEPGSICRMRTGCSVYSSVCTRPVNSPALAWALRPRNALSIAMAATFGPRPNPTRAQPFILPCHSMSIPEAFSPLAERFEATDITRAARQDFASMSAAKGQLQVLIVEDSENDAELLDLELQRAGYDTSYRRVETRSA